MPLLIVAALVALAAPASAQDAPEPCRFLCSPEFKVEPTFTIGNLFGGARVQDLATGRILRERREITPEIILSLDLPTRLPRLGFTLESILIPGEDAVELEFEMNVTLIRAEQTGHWLESHIDAVDKYSPGERPHDAGRYTQKLNLELDTALFVFRWLPEGHWLRDVELEGSLDYVATGLPRAGDRIDNELYLDDASRWSLSIVIVIPVAPR